MRLYGRGIKAGARLGGRPRGATPRSLAERNPGPDPRGRSLSQAPVRAPEAGRPQPACFASQSRDWSLRVAGRAAGCRGSSPPSPRLQSESRALPVKHRSRPWTRPLPPARGRGGGVTRYPSESLLRPMPEPKSPAPGAGSRGCAEEQALPSAVRGTAQGRFRVGPGPRLPSAGVMGVQRRSPAGPRQGGSRPPPAARPAAGPAGCLGCTAAGGDTPHPHCTLGRGPVT